MPYRKLRKIASWYGNSSIDELIKQLYEIEQLSGEAVAKKLSKETGIPVTSRAIYDRLKILGISRNKSLARKLAIDKGRIDYSIFKKPLKSSELRKGISLGLRYKILKRDNFRCTLCGNDSSYMRLVVDHIIPIVRGGNNNENNLRTLCFACNHGKMITDNEK